MNDFHSDTSFEINRESESLLNPLHIQTDCKSSQLFSSSNGKSSYSRCRHSLGLRVWTLWWTQSTYAKAAGRITRCAYITLPVWDNHCKWSCATLRFVHISLILRALSLLYFSFTCSSCWYTILDPAWSIMQVDTISKFDFFNRITLGMSRTVHQRIHITLPFVHTRDWMVIGRYLCVEQ